MEAVVLSCEVGCAKPAPQIFQLALGRLGVAAQEALLVDDQQAYCDGAAELGLTAVRIDRRADLVSAGSVTTLTEVDAMLRRWE